MHESIRGKNPDLSHGWLVSIIVLMVLALLGGSLASLAHAQTAIQRLETEFDEMAFAVVNALQESHIVVAHLRNSSELRNAARLTTDRETTHPLHVLIQELENRNTTISRIVVWFPDTGAAHSAAGKLVETEFRLRDPELAGRLHRLELHHGVQWLPQFRYGRLDPLVVGMINVVAVNDTVAIIVLHIPVRHLLPIGERLSFASASLLVGDESVLAHVGAPRQPLHAEKYTGFQLHRLLDLRSNITLTAVGDPLFSLVGRLARLLVTLTFVSTMFVACAVACQLSAVPGRVISQAIARVEFEGPVVSERPSGTPPVIDSSDPGRVTGIGFVRKRVEDILEHRFSEARLRVPDIAAEVGLSSKYLSVRYRQESGRSIMGTLTGIRMRHAERLLVDTNMTVRQVAQAVGYASPQYFARAFQKTNRMAPKAYRVTRRRGVRSVDGARSTEW